MTFSDFNCMLGPTIIDRKQACREAVWFHQTRLLGESIGIEDIVEAMGKVPRAAQ